MVVPICLGLDPAAAGAVGLHILVEEQSLLVQLLSRPGEVTIMSDFITQSRYNVTSRLSPIYIAVKVVS